MLITAVTAQHMADQRTVQIHRAQRRGEREQLATLEVQFRPDTAKMSAAPN